LDQIFKVTLNKEITRNFQPSVAFLNALDHFLLIVLRSQELTIKVIFLVKSQCGIFNDFYLILVKRQSQSNSSSPWYWCIFQLTW